MSQVVLEEEVVESWFSDDPDMEIQVKTLNSKSDTSANYATTSANIINTLLQVQTMHYGKPSIDDDERVLMVTFPRDTSRWLREILPRINPAIFAETDGFPGSFLFLRYIMYSISQSVSQS